MGGGDHHHGFIFPLSGQSSSMSNGTSLSSSCKSLVCGISPLIPVNTEIQSLKDSSQCPLESSSEQDSSLPSQSPQLIQLCSKQFGFFPLEKDCQKFVRCSFGDPFVMSCPPGTLWNQICKCCDWPARVKYNPGNYTLAFVRS